jgi:hypothetical protein
MYLHPQLFQDSKGLTAFSNFQQHMVTSSQLMEINLLCYKTTFICFKIALGIAFTIPHPLEFFQCFLGALEIFKNLNNSFRFSKYVMGFPFLEGGNFPQTEYI